MLFENDDQVMLKASLFVSGRSEVSWELNHLTEGQPLITDTCDATVMYALDSCKLGFLWVKMIKHSCVMASLYVYLTTMPP